MGKHSKENFGLRRNYEETILESSLMINKIVKSKNIGSGIILLLSILLCENLDLAA